ncbi:MAG: response regulator transcription factor [Sphingobacteriales bacterium]|nr:MAG: response regulator transcription factor [Sphingobacteriales bacterium]
MIAVAVYDDNTSRLQSLEMLLNWSEGIRCCGTFPNADNIVSEVQDAGADLVLMDINMPGTNGIDAVKKLRAAGWDGKVLMQTVFDDDNNLFSSILAGADGYILKKSSPQQTVQAIFDCHEGGAAFTSSMAKKVLTAFQQLQPLKTNHDIMLSDREQEVLQLLVKGYSHKMIAAECFISIHTVNSHVKKIYQKLQVNSVSEAVSKAIKEGIV